MDRERIGAVLIPTPRSRQRLGFMQGRLCPRIDGRIQAFPWPFWESEFAAAMSVGLRFIEWTLDAERLEENPLMTEAGRARIRQLVAAHSVRVASVTGDCFMQEPFWKVTGQSRERRLDMFRRVVVACGEMAITHLVVPLVDAGGLTSQEEEDVFRKHLLDSLPLLQNTGVTVVVESDYTPSRQSQLIRAFPSECVGINFDMGNSAHLGWNPSEELRLLGPRIGNVHVKDRPLGGGTVPLGMGDVDFNTVFATLAEVGYAGRFILQTARAEPGEDVLTLKKYADFVAGFLEV